VLPGKHSWYLPSIFVLLLSTMLLWLLLVNRVQGTKSSKKKKQAKLKRVMATLKKHARKEAALGSEGFAALHLLHDPQV
jgi:hypothetical protein